MIEQIMASEIEMVVGGCVAEPGEPDPDPGIAIKVPSLEDIMKDFKLGS